MHRALRLPEILHLVCNKLGNNSNFKSLVALACTCRLFQDPAFSVVWYDLDNLLLLIECMPRDLWKINNKTWKWESFLSFERPILPTDWSRFKVYAQYVRQFSFSSYHSVFSATALQALCQAAELQCLLPNLAKLYWHTYDDTIFPFIGRFLGPRTEQLEVWHPGASSVQLSCLAHISCHYPSLTHVSFLNQGDPNSLASTIDTISTTICGWKELRHLSVDSLSVDALYHVASLSFLKSLVLTNVRDTDRITDESLVSRTVDHFPSLETLSVSSERITTCLDLLNMISSISPLNAVCFMIQTHATSSQCQDLFNALKGHCNRSTVTSITIGFKGLGDEPYDTVLGQNHLQALHVFSNLQRLKVITEKFDLSDHGVKEMALAWPRIDTLLLFGRSVIGSPQVTLSGLSSLAQCCPRLNQLGIAFDARSVPLDLQRGQAKALEELYVLNSPIVDSVPIAAFLRDVFPSLHALHYSGGGTFDPRLRDIVSEQAKSWTQVEECLAGGLAPNSESSLV